MATEKIRRVRSASAAAEALRDGRTWPTMAADLRRMVPRWHFEMLADTPRNTALLEAIAAVVEEGQLVLDIGTGAGLTALAAARAGGRVITCETNPVIAELARQVIAANGPEYERRIRVIDRRSSELAVGADLPRPADVMVAEVFDADLFSEGALPAIDDARRRLLQPDAVMLPNRGQIWCALVESRDLYGLNRVDVVDGFDLSAFNKVATKGAMYASVGCLDWRMLSPPTRLFELDFTDPSTPQQSRTIATVDGDGGVVHAVVAWFVLGGFGEGRRLTNSPQVRSHWKQAVFVTDAVRVAGGQHVILDAEHDTRSLSLAMAVG